MNKLQHLPKVYSICIPLHEWSAAFERCSVCMRGCADQGYDKQIKQMRVIKTAGSTNGMTNSGNYGGKCMQLQQMRYTHFALLRCCINLNGLFLRCNSYYIKLAIESPVSFCCNSAEVFIMLFSPKQIICSQRSSCRNPQTALRFIILLGNLERTLIRLVLQVLRCSYHFIKTNFGFPRSDFVIVGSLPQFYVIYGLFSFQDKKPRERRGEWEQDALPKF